MRRPETCPETERSWKVPKTVQAIMAINVSETLLQADDDMDIADDVVDKESTEDEEEEESTEDIVDLY